MKLDQPAFDRLRHHFDTNEGFIAIGEKLDAAVIYTKNAKATKQIRELVDREFADYSDHITVTTLGSVKPAAA